MQDIRIRGNFGGGQKENEENLKKQIGKIQEKKRWK